MEVQIYTLSNNTFNLSSPEVKTLKIQYRWNENPFGENERNLYKPYMLEICKLNIEKFSNCKKNCYQEFISLEKWRERGSSNGIECMVHRNRFLNSFPIFIVRQCILRSRGTFIDSFWQQLEDLLGVKWTKTARLAKRVRIMSKRRHLCISIHVARSPNGL